MKNDYKLFLIVHESDVEKMVDVFYSLLEDNGLIYRLYKGSILLKGDKFLDAEALRNTLHYSTAGKINFHVVELVEIDIESSENINELYDWLKSDNFKINSILSIFTKCDEHIYKYMNLYKQFTVDFVENILFDIENIDIDVNKFTERVIYDIKTLMEIMNEDSSDFKLFYDLIKKIEKI